MNTFSAKDSVKLKGIAICLMMVFHCLSSTKRLGGYDVNFAPLDEATAIRFFLYFKICVSIFAFITGYGLYLSYRSKCRDGRSATRWTAQRYVKTFAGFMFVYVCVFVGAALLTGRLQRTYLSSGRINAIVYILLDACGLAHLLGTPSLMTGWWYMSAAAVFIALVPIFCEIDRRVGMLPLVACVVSLPRILGTGFPGSSEPYSFIPALLMGMVFAKHDVFNRLAAVRLATNETLDKVVQFVLYAGLLAVSILLFDRLDRTRLWEYHFALSAIGCILFCWKYLLPLPVIGPVLEFLGAHSMNIYFVHSFIRVRFQSVIYASESMFLIPLTLLAAALAVSLVIEGLKRLVRFDEARDRLVARLAS